MMTMNIGTKLMACALVAMSCGSEVTDEQNALAVSTQALSACPTSPSPYQPGMRLYPTNSLSTSTVYLQDPNDARFFIAYGFDIRKNTCAFFVRGLITRELLPMQLEVSDNINVIERQNPTDISSASTAQIGRVPVPPFPGGTEQLAQQIATRIYNAALAPY